MNMNTYLIFDGKINFVRVNDAGISVPKVTCQIVLPLTSQNYPDSKVNGANMWPTWILSAPDGPHIGYMNLAIRVHGCVSKLTSETYQAKFWNAMKINSFYLRQYGCHIADDIFRCIFMNKKFCMLITISLNFVANGAIDNNPALG